MGIQIYWQYVCNTCVKIILIDVMCVLIDVRMIRFMLISRGFRSLQAQHQVEIYIYFFKII